MNRFYPGKADGTQTERASLAITKEVVEKSDHLIDLHGAMQLAMLFNINRGKDTAAVQPREFMILAKRDKPKAPQLSIAQRMKAAALGETVR